MPIAREVCLHNHDPFIDPESCEPQVMTIKRGGEKERKGKRSLRASRAVRTRVRETVRLGNTGHVRQ
jgi:hypothetical protein